MRCVLILLFAGSTALAQDDIQQRIYRARDRALPALVNVRPVLDVFRGGRRRQSTATGSGVIVTKDGLVVTNFHVAGHAKKVYCTLADKTRVPASLVGGDPATDLAVLRLDEKELKRLGSSFRVAKLGSDSPPQVGEIVLALGSPRGLSMSLTRGVISNTERYFGGDITLPTGELTGMYNNWLQTDAAINPGNSGGPLVNLSGEVIGINSRGVPGGDGLGFAIPADVVRHVFEQIVEHGRVIRAWVGIDRNLEPLGFEAEVRGVRVGHVAKNSPAAEAGLQPGDIIRTLGGLTIDAMHMDDLPPIRRHIAEARVGHELGVRLWRDGKQLYLKLKPRELPSKKARQFAARRLGLTARVITGPYARRAGLSSTDGVLVTGVSAGGPAASGDVRQGDIILSIDRKAVKDLAAFEKLYDELVKAKREKVLVSVKRGTQVILRVLSPATRDPEEDE
jgi:serine protease Do